VTIPLRQVNNNWNRTPTPSCAFMACIGTNLLYFTKKYLRRYYQVNVSCLVINLEALDCCLRYMTIRGSKCEKLQGRNFLYIFHNGVNFLCSEN
jgi:hypothetical protein